MEWRDDAVILGARRHGEADLILELMTRSHGRHLGLARGGRSRKVAAALQPGNEVEATWRARIDEHLGAWRIEAKALRGVALIDCAPALYGLATLAAGLRLLPERDPHETLFDGLSAILPHLAEPGVAAPAIVRFEAALLAGLGFGLDLNACALTGVREDLGYVSPRSGRAVSVGAAGAYTPRLLPLPGFMAEGGAPEDATSLAAGFALTGYFLRKHVWDPRGQTPPPERARLIEAALRAFGAGA